MPPLPDATIDVTNIQFVPATGTGLQLSTATFALANGGGAVVQLGAKFEVNRKVRVIFAFPAGQYEPLDIWFLQTAGAGDPAGKSNLTGTTPHGNLVEVKAERIDLGASWKILIPIMRLGDRSVGLVDPEISNSNDKGDA